MTVKGLLENVSSGAGAIAGIGTGPQPEPGLKTSKIITRTNNLRVLKSKSGKYKLDFNGKSK